MVPLSDDVPRVRFPVVTVVLAALTTLVSGAIFSLPEDLGLWSVQRLGVVPVSLWGGTLEGAAGPPLVPAVLTLVTSLFVHGDAMHLFGNLWVLWIYGDNVEDALGPFRYAFFYFACGVAASLLQAGAEHASSVPTIGASGAIAGVAGAFLLLHPSARLLVSGGIVVMRLPAVVVIVLWGLLQVWSAWQGLPGVAWYAHIGGLVAGLVLTPLLRGRDVAVVPAVQNRTGAKDERPYYERRRNSPRD